jgi:hypothetical protein
MAAPLPGGGDEVTLEIVHGWNLGKEVGNYLRRAKKRCLEILHAKRQGVREKAYKDLLNLAGRVRGYAWEAMWATTERGPKATRMVTFLTGLRMQ